MKVKKKSRANCIEDVTN